MPDRRKHRGKHPEDERLFAVERHPILQTAVHEYSWLLSHGYPKVAALKLVGDRYRLHARQRMVVRRSACSDQALRRRETAMVDADDLRGAPLAIDGYNLLITIESALSGGLICIGRDGSLRDIASVHGTYRKVSETVPALNLMFRHIRNLFPACVNFYLDRPVSNSGRLKALMFDVLQTCDDRDSHPVWRVELLDNPDAVLCDCDGVVITSDSVVLDRCHAWFNLAALVVRESIPKAWCVDLRRL